MGALVRVFPEPVAGTRMRNAIVFSVLAASLLAFPAEAACSSCCPSEPQRELAFGSASCCGDQCEPTLERAPADPVPAASYRSDLGPTAATVSPVPPPERVAAALAAAAFDLPPPPLLRPSPLRL